MARPIARCGLTETADSPSREHPIPHDCKVERSGHADPRVHRAIVGRAAQCKLEALAVSGYENQIVLQMLKQRQELRDNLLGGWALVGPALPALLDKT
eukprot:5401947-Prymnesium_polylepis.1